ncbi:MAG: hypothetical protein PHI64_07985 [Zoogloea sp.]|uniref:hypothetical protein n=1 Tax=Zoogloea sp. TaxID=49181 RepID=UPI0026382920|nr:hypothetical protein [Zoogloea sp.]MDD2988885.1 hypothetical protein [Zoogloea sp.]
MTNLNTLYDAPSSVAARASEAQAAPQGSAPLSTLYDAPTGPVQQTQAAPPSARAPQPQVERTSDERAQEAFYGKPEEVPAVEVPENIKAMREADGLRALYSPQGSYASVLPDDLWAGDETAKAIPEPVQRAALAELREMAADLSMSNDDVRALQSIARQIPEAPSDADRIVWREQAVTRLNETYGNGAAQAFRDARAFIAQDPRRAKILDNKGLGDHPDTVLMVARLARQARMQGKLK